MPRTLVIWNPNSGRGKGKRRWPDLRSQIEGALGPNVEFAETQRSSNATELARAAANQFDLIVAAGGDGTICETANGLIGSDSAFGILPLGTGNDLCRTLGIGPSFESALSTLKAGRSDFIDIGRWQSESQNGYFVNIAGAGFDAAVAARINHGARLLRGTTAYLAATLREWVTFRPQRLTATIGDAAIDRPAMLLAIANAQFYGGGMKVAPMASVTDGALDVVLVEALGKIAFLRAFPSVYKGAHISHERVSHFSASHVSIRFEQPTNILMDGELIQCQQVDCDVLPRALKVILP